MTAWACEKCGRPWPAPGRPSAGSKCPACGGLMAAVLRPAGPAITVRAADGPALRIRACCEDPSPDVARGGHLVYCANCDADMMILTWDADETYAHYVGTTRGQDQP